MSLGVHQMSSEEFKEHIDRIERSYLNQAPKKKLKASSKTKQNLSFQFQGRHAKQEQLILKEIRHSSHKKHNKENNQASLNIEFSKYKPKQPKFVTLSPNTQDLCLPALKVSAKNPKSCEKSKWRHHPQGTEKIYLNSVDNEAQAKKIQLFKKLKKLREQEKKELKESREKVFNKPNKKLRTETAEKGKITISKNVCQTLRNSAKKLEIHQSQHSEELIPKQQQSLKAPSTKERMKIKKLSKVELNVMDSLLDNLKTRKRR